LTFLNFHDIMLSETSPFASCKEVSLMSNQFSKELLAFAEDHIWVSEHLESLFAPEQTTDKSFKRKTTLANFAYH
jgi:hypothetical protein